MSKYAKLDEAILAAIRADHVVWADRDTCAEAELIAAKTRSDLYRVIDRRMATLRKCGRIEFCAGVNRITRFRLKGDACADTQVLPAGAKEEFEVGEKT